MGLHPLMVGGGVVRHEIEQQLDVAPRQLLAELLDRRVATQRLADGVRRNREAGAANILLGQVGQNNLKFGAPLRITARNCLPGSAGLPDAQQPDPVETLPAKPSSVASSTSARVIGLPASRDKR
jgi:hypothetical protein